MYMRRNKLRTIPMTSMIVSLLPVDVDNGDKFTEIKNVAAHHLLYA
jgi:hypothetical protein